MVIGIYLNTKCTVCVYVYTTNTRSVTIHSFLWRTEFVQTIFAMFRTEYFFGKVQIEKVYDQKSSGIAVKPVGLI